MEGIAPDGSTVHKTLKHGTPTDDELEDLGCEIGEKWEELGRRLGVRKSRLQEIDHARAKLSGKGYHMLIHWKEKTGSAATYEVLSNALKHKFVERQDLAEQFCYINATQPPAGPVPEGRATGEVLGDDGVSAKDQDDFSGGRSGLKRKRSEQNSEQGYLSWKIFCANATSRVSEKQDPQEEREKVDRHMKQKVVEGMEKFDLSSPTGLCAFHVYLVGELHLRNVSFDGCSIIITAQCCTLEILERLWDDYCSGHLNAVAEKFLITEEVKDELGMETIKLTTTILKEDYLACRLSLMQISRINIKEDILQAILIGSTIATFLLRTGRVLNAIEVWEECLIFLNDKALIIEENHFNFLNFGIYQAVFNSCCLIPDKSDAIKHGRKLLDIFRECGKTAEEENLTVTLANMCEQQFKYVEAREFYQRAMNIMIETGDKKGEAYAYFKAGTISYRLGEYNKAKEYLEKALAITIEVGDRKGEASSYGILGNVFQSLGEYDKAKEYLEKALPIIIEIGDRAGEGSCYGNLGTVFKSLSRYDKAKEYLEKALSIKIQLGDRAGEASCYGNLGTVFQSLAEYDKAKKYLEKALAIRIQISDRAGEAVEYGNLGAVFRSFGEYVIAKEYHEKALSIRKQIGDRAGEAADYANLGTVFQSLGNYGKAERYLEEALDIRKHIGDRKGEASSYRKLGTVFQSLGEYRKAKESLEKALSITVAISDKAEEANCYGNLGTVFQSVGDYDKAEKYLEKALAISNEIDDKAGEASSYEKLGTMFESVAKYDEAKDYLERALAITKEIGDKAGEASSYEKLGTVFQSVAKYDEAGDYLQRALAISREIGDKAGEASSYEKLGTVFQSVAKYDKAIGYLERALAISREIGNKAGEASCFGNLGTLFQYLASYDKAKEYLEKANAIRIQIGDRAGEAEDYGNLGALHQALGEYVKAEDYVEKALSISRYIGNLEKEFRFLCLLATVKSGQGKNQEAFDCLLLSIRTSESLRKFLRDNDDFKALSSNVHYFAFRNLSALLCSSENPSHALYVLELVRARALADLMVSQYSVEWQISADPQSWNGIENIMKKESNSSCLYISYFEHDLFLWVLKASGIIHFRRVTVDEKLGGAGLFGNIDDFFAYRSFQQLSSEDGREARLTLFYQMIIAPVVDLLETPEIIIVPEPCLYRVPFPALLDESGKYLTETFRIRIVPSLTTLKFIQDSPADYHIQSGALIVGDPFVGRVRYKGRLQNVSPLPSARNEARMIGRLLGVQPLIGEQATKQAVLERLHWVGLIHFAGPANAERGEIALSPVHTFNRIPKEEDYLLTMSDIKNVKLRAKLVVLSCCHSAGGQIRAEGVIGIARAFLGSGARSVLVALCAISDKATEQLMCRFYEHLVRGESASESLHQAMKWMRGNGFDKVCDWAPFMLIGDNVTFDFGE